MKDTEEILVQPFRDDVLVRLSPVKESTKGSVVYTNSQSRDQKCEVIALGADLCWNNMTPGDTVLIDNGKFKIIDNIFEDEHQYAIVKFDDVLCKINVKK